MIAQAVNGEASEPWFDRNFHGIARDWLDRVKLGTVGLPLEGTDCRIGEDGEILLRRIFSNPISAI